MIAAREAVVSRLRRRGQGGYMLAAVLTLLGLISIILGAVLAMTGTAFRLSESLRSGAETVNAADSAMEEVLNYLRKVPGNNAAEREQCANAAPGNPTSYDSSTFDDSNPEAIVPLAPFELPDSTVVQVQVTCQITAVQGDSRFGVLEAFVDGSSTRSGRASFQIVDQTTNADLSRVVISEWQLGNVTDSLVDDGPPTLEVEYLIVGGGGAGGPCTGGGGGGGGVVTNFGGLPLGVSSGSFQVVVGAGGVGGQPAGPCSNPTVLQAANGGDSSFNGIAAVGGGGGGVNARPGAAGGSGGGGGHDGQGGTSSALQGNDGGSGIDTINVGTGVFGAGGGGGAGAVGQGGSVTKGGNGGGGLSSNITGTARFYAGGGGGGAFGGSTPAPGGAGGGGNGGYGPAATPVPPTNGAANTGGGGGGQRTNVNTTGGSGGSGIVVIRYAGPQKADGGTVTSAGGFTIHTFTTPGPATITVLPQVEYLVVGGGGAGGGRTGGGGGAGGVLTNEGSPVGIAEGSYQVVVGGGGPGGQPCPSPSLCPGANGGDSRFDSFVSTGGGGGGDNGDPGRPGGSGGGGGHDGLGGAGVALQGNNGGRGIDTINVGTGVFGGGGGGGAGGAGQGGSTVKGGDGGAGITVSLTGSPVVYGGGGGGGAFGGTVPAPGAAGSGGNGGFGSIAPVPPTDGVANTGGGGGGQRTNVNTTGGSGGSGIVVIRYTGAPRATGGTVTRVGGFTYHTFATPGTYTITFN